MPDIQVPSAFRFLYQDEARYRAVHGGRGSGKSHSIAQALVVRARHEPLRILCGREIQKSIKDSVKRLIDDKIDACGYSAFFTSTDTEIRGKNGSLFLFAGLRTNPDSIKSMEGLDIGWVEEANTVSQRSLDLLIPTIRKPSSELWFSWNPRYAKDPVDNLFRGGEPPPNSIVRKVGFEQNPWFPDVLREDMEWDRRRDPEKYAHIWLGEYERNSEARVFRNWTVERCEPPTGARFYYGADWGFSVDPTVLVRCWIEGRKVVVDQEAYKVGCEIDHTPELFDKVAGSRLWPIRADSASPQTISYMQRNGFPRMVPAVKGANSVEEGVNFLKSYDIVVHPDCTHLIDELTLYSYKVDKLTDEVLPMLEDKSNHCIAEGEKVRCMRGEISIEDVTVEDLVLTRSGFCRVLFSGPMDVNRKIVCVATSVGALKCTPEHRVFTKRGFVRADALKYGDEVITGFLQCQNEQSGTVGSIAVIQKATDFQTRRILGDLHQEGVTSYIVTFGSIITAAFRKGLKSITRMKTQPTTISQTLSAYLIQSMYPGTSGRKTGFGDSRDTSNAFAISRNPGIRRHRGSKSIEKLALWLTSHFALPGSRALSVESSFYPGNSATLTGSVRERANLHIDAHKEWIASTWPVHNAEAPSEPTSTGLPQLAHGHVLTVSDAGVSPRVYDLTVEGSPEFFVNGVLVHNCIDALRYAVEQVRVPGAPVPVVRSMRMGR